MENSVIGLQEAIDSFIHRLTPVEGVAGRQGELESGLRGLETGLRDLDERLRSETSRHRKDSDDVAMALRGLIERAQTADQQLNGLVPRVGAHEERLSGLGTLAERVPELDQQIAALRALSEKMPELDQQVGALRALSEKVPELDQQIAALRALSDKVPELEAQIESALRAHHELEATLDEKTHQGRREAEDIRSQIAPLLEERVRRHESDALLFSEMDRLRESLSESLHDLAERLRHAVRE
jgi:chromosome segregation ATPase